MNPGRCGGCERNSMTGTTAPTGTTDLSGRVAIVAGGARGIGRACALRLAGLGASVAVFDVNLDAAAEFGETLGAATVEEELRGFGGAAMAIQADLTRGDEAERAIAAVHEAWARIDILVIPAGGAITAFPRSLASLSPDDDLSVSIDVNLRTVLNTCRAVVPLMAKTGGGAIVTLSSGAGITTMPGGYLAGYGAVKAAVAHYTRSLAAEVGPLGIRANCIAPGLIQTARLVAQSTVTGLVNDSAADAVPLGRLGEASDIADAVQFLVSPLSSDVTGQVLAVDGGATMR
jgi:NAD(P)-dependent dehydrogenase (short-subunit alcohol dehydrogenase family)